MIVIVFVVSAFLLSEPRERQMWGRNFDLNCSSSLTDFRRPQSPLHLRLQTSAITGLWLGNADHDWISEQGLIGGNLPQIVMEKNSLFNLTRVVSCDQVVDVGAEGISALV